MLRAEGMRGRADASIGPYGKGVLSLSLYKAPSDHPSPAAREFPSRGAFCY